MKFKYTNSNLEESIIEAIPLTTDLYEELIEIDKEFLNNVSSGDEIFFKETEYVEAAKSILTSFGKAKESSCPESTDEDKHCVLYLINKTILKRGSDVKSHSQTPKRILRSKMVTSKIRSFSKDKMELNFNLDA